VSSAALLGRQFKYTNIAFWRNPASAFFTFAFPLMFLVIFTSLLGSGKTEVAPGIFIDQAKYYVAAMGSFAVITATYTNLAMSVSFQRDGGVLKRTRGTPLPGSIYLGARVSHALAISLILVAITSAFGAIAYGADIPTGVDLVRFLVSIAVGGMAFAALGLATTAIVPNAEAGPPIVNAIILPLLFVSGVFIPLTTSSPQWMKTLGDIFPVKHFVEATMSSFYGAGYPIAFEWSDVLFVAAWGVVGLVLAIRFFSWEPRK
jgi:ABC-2 type transport system permease protein